MLAAVERQLAGEPVVFIGVHSPKFPTEGDAEMVRQAIRRHGVTHPVVVDTGFTVWREYAVRAWPTLVLVGPDGAVLGAASGEPDHGPLLSVLTETLQKYEGQLVREPLPIRPEPAPPGTLAFPGGIAVGDQVFVADTGHHQIVVCASDGTELTRFGSGRPGLVDGHGGEAGFYHPHGLAVHGDRLYVADTSNHAVRVVELGTGEVATLAGTGRRGRGAASGGAARDTDLRSPWDVAVTPDGEVIVAMAGSHQLWVVAGGMARVLAGSGREARVDGDYASCAFAQPSGLACAADGGLYVADSEISAIRRVAGGTVTTVAGGDLFDFGDVDGIGDEVRLQHPVGIAAGLDGGLLVADTLNHKIKHLEPYTRGMRTLLGNGTPFDAALAELERRPALPRDARERGWCREPEALAWDGTQLLVADTGNQRVVAVDPSTGAARVWLG